MSNARLPRALRARYRKKLQLDALRILVSGNPATIPLGYDPLEEGLQPEAAAAHPAWS